MIDEYIILDENMKPIGQTMIETPDEPKKTVTFGGGVIGITNTSLFKVPYECDKCGKICKKPIHIGVAQLCIDCYLEEERIRKKIEEHHVSPWHPLPPLKPKPWYPYPSPYKPLPQPYTPFPKKYWCKQ